MITQTTHRRTRITEVVEPETLKQGDIIINSRNVLVVTGNRNASGTTLEVEVFNRKDGTVKGVRSHGTDALFAKCEGWALYRVGSTRKAPTYSSPEARLRCRVHALSRELGYDEGKRRNQLETLVNKRYARLLDRADLEYVVEVFERRLVGEPDYDDGEVEKFVARPVNLEPVSDDEALDVLGVAA